MSNSGDRLPGHSAYVFGWADARARAR